MRPDHPKDAVLNRNFLQLALACVSVPIDLGHLDGLSVDRTIEYCDDVRLFVVGDDAR